MPLLCGPNRKSEKNFFSHEKKCRGLEGEVVMWFSVRWCLTRTSLLRKGRRIVEFVRRALYYCVQIFEEVSECEYW